MAVTLSPKFQIVIPKEVREALSWKPGQKIEVLQFGDHVTLVPVKPIEEMMGFAEGIDTDVRRDKTDRV